SAAAARSAALRAPAPASRSSAASAAATDAEIPPWVDAPMATEIVAAEVVPRPARAALSSAAIAAVPVDAEPEALSSADIALGDRWSALVRSLCEAGAIAALVRELAMQAQCVAVSQQGLQGDMEVWRLRVERETLRGGSHRERLESAIAQALKQPVRLELEAGATTDSPAQRDAAQRERRQRAAEELIQNDPQVIALLQQYKSARIVPGSIKPI
ncbi:MAG TPA: DNA polymerase III subunit gamma/tau C-terminal domain-containing protein, partial [Methylibium sp.]